MYARHINGWVFHWATIQSSYRLTSIATTPHTNVSLDMYNVRHIKIQRWTWPRYAFIIAMPFTSLKLMNSLKSADIRYVCVPRLLNVPECILTCSMPTWANSVMALLFSRNLNMVSPAMEMFSACLYCAPLLLPTLNKIKVRHYYLVVSPIYRNARRWTSIFMGCSTARRSFPWIGRSYGGLFI